MIVADTSLLAAFWLPGDQTELAESVKARDRVWAAPVVWRAEFRNVLAAGLRAGWLTEAEANTAYLNAQQDLDRNEFTVPTERVMQLVRNSQCSAYDCEYVALAQDLAVPLVTADPGLVRAFPQTAVALETFGQKFGRKLVRKKK